MNQSANDQGLHIRNVSHFYDMKASRLWALRNFTLTVEPNEFVCILGPSGSGKSTLLRILTGLAKPSQGEVLLGGKRIEGPGIDRGVVFQEPALFPWLKVRGNLTFGMKKTRLTREEIDARAASILKIVGLEKFEDLYPRQLSGGMRSRVSVARAWALPDTKALLMDEPFAALDAITRRHLQMHLVALWIDRPRTIVYITHDIEEAIYLADRIVVMTPSPGTIAHEFRVGLERPRDRDGIAFAELRTQVDELLKHATSSAAHARSQ